MKIIQGQDSLKQSLQKIKNSKVTIITAFASKTIDMVKDLLDNGNELTLIVGTINYFSDPIFIDQCCTIADTNPKLKLFVDFRGNKSIHWKLYLVEPDIVLIGSPNFTKIGLSMERDTAVRLQSSDLYQEYRALVKQLQDTYEILASDHKEFKARFKIYEKLHRRRTTLPPVVNPGEIPDFVTWLEQESTQGLPIFIWTRNFTEAEVKTFRTKVKPQLMADNSFAGPEITLVGVWDDSCSNLPYENGMVLLTVRSTGSIVRLQSIDWVVYKEGNCWLCRVKGKRTVKPFKMTPELENAICDMVTNTWCHQNKTYLDSEDLKKLAEQLETNRRKKK